MNERITKLEMRFMLQQNTIEELNGIVCRHEQVIVSLGREVIRLKEQISMALPSLTVAPGDDEPPPHY